MQDIFAKPEVIEFRAATERHIQAAMLSEAVLRLSKPKPESCEKAFEAASKSGETAYESLQKSKKAVEKAKMMREMFKTLKEDNREINEINEEEHKKALDGVLKNPNVNYEAANMVIQERLESIYRYNIALADADEWFEKTYAYHQKMIAFLEEKLATEQKEMNVNESGCRS